MRTHAFSHLADREVVHALVSRSAAELGVAADVIALIGEFDSRKLFVREGHASTFEFCVHVLHLSEDAAYKRIQVARAARAFPAVLEAIADGRLHLTGGRMLAPHLTQSNADELLEAAAYKTKTQIEELLAQRNPRTEAMPLVMAMPAATAEVPTTAPVAPAPDVVQPKSCQLVPGPVEQKSIVMPIASKRFMLQLMMDEGMRERLHYAQELMSHRIPSRDPQQVIDQAIRLLINWAEKSKCAMTDKPRTVVPKATDRRTMPAHVRRAVWLRDGGRCTYVSENGHRCDSRRRLEFDHIVPVARGGDATVENVRLRCHPHNQYAAEQTFGTEFMERKRQLAKEDQERAAGGQ